MIGRGTTTLANVDVTLGGGESSTRFQAARLDGLATASGFAGTLTGATARIGPVPFLLSEGQGNWRFAGGRVRDGSGSC